MPRGNESTEVRKSQIKGIEEITKGTGTHKQTETVSRYFDLHGCLPQSNNDNFKYSST